MREIKQTIIVDTNVLLRTVCVQLVVDRYSYNTQSNFERIDIAPDIFDEAPPLDFLRDKFLVKFINLSDIDVPLEVRYLLQFGEKFGLPINKDSTLIEFIKHIENNITGRPNNIINFVRNNSLPILNRFHNNFPSPTSTDKLILDWLRTTKSLLMTILIYSLQTPIRVTSLLLWTRTPMYQEWRRFSQIRVLTPSLIKIQVKN